MQLNLALIWITIIICAFLAWFFNHRDGHKERMKLIEQGINPKEKSGNERRMDSFLMRAAILVVGISIGLLVIAILAKARLLDRYGNAFPLAILGLCGGISMMIANLIKWNRDKK